MIPDTIIPDDGEEMAAFVADFNETVLDEFIHGRLSINEYLYDAAALFVR
jgi:hypothetical protein